MTKDNTLPEPLQANLFHAGNTCPYCQENIQEKQLIVSCPNCGSLMHDQCWGHNDGCASYHCDKRTTAGKNCRPEITISVGELDSIIVPPKPVRRSTQELAQLSAPPKPTRRSRLAIISLIIVIASAFGLSGVLSGGIAPLALGLLVGVLGSALAVISLVRVNSKNELSGFAIAAPAVLLGCLLIVTNASLIAILGRQLQVSERVNLQLSELPSEEVLSKLSPSRANALRANAVVTCRGSSSILGQLSYGSAVITKLTNQKAYMLTNKHVIGLNETETTPGRHDIEITFYNGESSKATVEWLAPTGVDIAILSCNTVTMTKYRTIPVLDELSTPSTRVFAIGNPMSFFWSYTEGVVSSVRERNFSMHEVLVYQTQTPINQGNSGGGLYTMDGRLLGINTWTLNKSFAEGLNFSISTHSITKLLGDKAAQFMQVSPLENVKVQE